jgi:O-antigen/teichoic acid export membrane protein
MPNKDQYIKRITKGAFIVFLGIFIGRLLGYVTRIFIARYLDVDGYGMFSLASAIMGIVTTIVVLGIPIGISRYIPFFVGKREWGKVRATIKSGAKITIPLGLLASVVLSHDIATVVFQMPDLEILLQIFSLSVPLIVVFNIALGTFRGFQDMKKSAIIENMLRPITTIAFLALLFYMGFGLMGTAIAYFSGYLLTAIVSVFFMFRLVNDMHDSDEESVTKELLLFSWPLLLVNYMWVIIEYSDTIMLGIFNTADIVGFYNVALPTAAMIYLISKAFGYIFMPVITEM